ncbi:MAG: class I SAM-dependent methyltransferase [Actinomycetota bacterium]|nr:class I SAM-dependent methyltransferase [Actinomycetota bacterium]
MATLHDIITRRTPPVPWEEGENIPWHDPAFSERMLAEHLNQDHDLASRRFALVDDHVDWIHRALLHERPAQILDLACGPGLYLTRLGQIGHRGVGIDFSPASVAHARQEAATENLPLHYVEGDIRSVEFGAGFDVVMLLYGQLNVFRRSEAAAIVKRARAALAPGGIFVAEPQTFDHVRNSGLTDSSWSGQSSGLFSDQPHLLLTESFWDAERRTGTQRFYVVATAGGTATQHSLSNEAYRDEELVSLFSDAGFRDVELLSSLTGSAPSNEMLVVVART